MSPDSHGKDRDRQRRQESERILDSVASQSETVGSSGFARTASRLSAHFKASDGPQDDPIEVLGKRIARILSLIAFVGLLVYLVVTYGTPR